MYILPPRVLAVNTTKIAVLKTGSEFGDTSVTDPWAAKAYQWTLTLTVTPQKHSSLDTPTPKQYNGLDIQVGDWVATAAGGKCYRIINIHDGATATLVQVDVEDVDRFSLIIDTSTKGTPTPTLTNGYIFQLDSEGMPILMGATANYLSANWPADMMSRFSYRNEALQFIRVNQPGHTFIKGDIIAPDPANPGQFILASVSDEIAAIGTVTDISIPGVDYFNYKPFGKIMYNISPAFTGNYGDIYYLDPANPGKLTTTKPANHSKPIYIQIDTTTGIVLDDNSSDDPIKYVVSPVTDGQTTFVLPTGALEVLEMTINGIETDNYTYDATTSTLTFDPVGNGYGIDSSDEVVLTYKV